MRVNSPSFAISANLILPVQVPANRAVSCLEGALTDSVVIAVDVGEGVGLSSSIGAGHRCAERISKVAAENAANARFILAIKSNGAFAGQLRRLERNVGDYRTELAAIRIATRSAHGTMNNLPDFGSINFVPEGFPLTSRSIREFGSNGL